MTLRTTLVGLGLVGSSIGLALKQTSAKFEIIGHDKDSDAAKRALKSGSVDRTDWNLIGACEGSDLIVLSTPLAEIRTTLAAIAGEVKAGCVVTDTARIKVPVLDWAREFLPPQVRFVGGHPIYVPQGMRADGKEGALDLGIPTADLFVGGIYCLTPGTDTQPEALQTASDLAEAVGAKAYYLDATEHDGLIAAVEGLPLVLAVALQAMVGTSPSSREMRQLCGSDLAAVTQLLSGEANDLTDVLSHNSANVSRCMDTLVDLLTRLRDLVSSKDRGALEQFVTAAFQSREMWIRRRPDTEETDYSDFDMSHMMLGDLFKPRRPREG